MTVEVIEIILKTRVEAELVIDRLLDLMLENKGKKKYISVSDLYRLVGSRSDNPVDFKWGWIDIVGTRIRRVQSGGYRLILPEPTLME